MVASKLMSSRSIQYSDDAVETKEDRKETLAVEIRWVKEQGELQVLTMESRWDQETLMSLVLEAIR